MSAGYKIQEHRQLVRKAQEVHIADNSIVTTYSYHTLNQYDKYGMLTSVKDRSGQLIWQALNENAKGQITSEKRGAKQTDPNLRSVLKMNV